MGLITFNGVSSMDFNILVERPPGYKIPSRDYEMVRIPGRNGDLFIDNMAYKNVELSYEIAIGSNSLFFPELAREISKWLTSVVGYARLEDSYEPDIYRMAHFSEGLDIENILCHAGRARVSFNCKPQRFLKSGEQKVTINSSNTILNNPTNQYAKPIIRVNGSGNGIFRLYHNGTLSKTIEIQSLSSYMDLNSEIADAYKGSSNVNSQISISGTDKNFPILAPGKNTITFSGGITSLEVTPNWWIV